MIRINEEGKESPQKIEFVMGGIKYSLEVEHFDAMAVTNLGSSFGVSLDLKCSAIDHQPCNSDFMEDVRALAKQYGLELVSIEVK